MIGFSRWLLQSGDFGNVTRYIYIESKDDFIDTGSLWSNNFCLNEAHIQKKLESNGNN
jgi:hypothetical protein